MKIIRHLLPDGVFEPTNRRWIAVSTGACVLAVIAFSVRLSAGHASAYRSSDSDAAFVQDLQRRSFLFFAEQTDGVSGLTRDRAPTDGGLSDAPASIAATGFALTAWCIADQHHWLPRGEARGRVLRTLEFVATRVPHEHGWLYHFLDMHSGQRVWHCEASTIDTALFLQGALAAREYLNDPQVDVLVDRLYARIDWQWALNGGSTLSHGWRPESGFLAQRWDSYSEMLGLYLLGIGAPSQPLPPSSWLAWKRGPVVKYAGRTFIQCAPLFAHQYAQAWFDFRGLRDGTVDYWQNSVDATLAQREWCAQHAGDFPGWSDELWGLTACDGPHGYTVQGGPFGTADQTDGTLAPCAAGGSLPFAPSECLAALHRMREVDGGQLWGRYGFVDSFNPAANWTSRDVIGIDVGITLVMAENLHSGLVWRYFMRAPEVRRGLKLAGFRPASGSNLADRSAVAMAR
jgi:hypothetical protein